MSKGLEILSYTIFDIDSETNSHKEENLKDVKEGSLKQFIFNLAYKTKSDTSTRVATFNEGSTALKILADLAKPEIKTDNLKHLAKRLLEAENAQNKRSGHLNIIKPGSLIITKFQGSDGQKILVSKIEFENYLAKKTFLSQQGLPQDKGLLKSCLLTISDDIIEENITLSDSNSTIATFWHQEFLDCKFIRDSTLNTKTAIKTIDSSLKFLKSESMDDYLDLKERANAYFLSNSTFEFKDFKKKLLEDYQPKLDGLDLSEVERKLDSLKKITHFDGKFEIDKKELKKNIKKQFNLDNEVTVLAKSGTSTIFKTTIDNARYIVIKTDKTPADLKEVVFFK
jgi:hypothetical protein